MRFELEAKSANITMRVPESLLMARVKTTAAEQGIPYQRFIRQAIDAPSRAEGLIAAASAMRDATPPGPAAPARIR